jgi:hypothetical protein
MLSPDDTKELIYKASWLKTEKNDNNITLVKNNYFFLSLAEAFSILDCMECYAF